MKNINKLLLLVMIMLCVNGALLAQFPQMGGDIDGEAYLEGIGCSVSLSSNGKTLAIGAPYANGGYTGLVRVYEWNGNTWTQKGTDFNGNATTSNYFGYSVNLSSDGNTLAIGVPYYDVGHVSIYEWNGNAWIQKGANINGEFLAEHFGNSVSLDASGDIIAVGAPYHYGNGANAGQVSIYEWNGTVWTQKGADINGEAVNDESGSSISLSANGNILAIGAPKHAIGGHVRIYEWNGNTWMQKGIDIDGEAALDNSGSSISLSSDGNILAIGALENDGNGNNAGHVRIYEWNGNAWLQKGTDIDGDAGNLFGTSVSLNADGNILAVSAPGYNNGILGTSPGGAFIYEWDGSTWIQKGISMVGEAVNDHSGRSISLSSNGNILAVGAPENSTNPFFASGHVRVYYIKGIYSFVYQDFNQNCIQDTLEVGLANRTLILNPGNILLQTDNNGLWYIDSLPIGTYTLTADTSSPNWQLTCPLTQTFTITNPDSSFQAPSFGYISNNPCPAPNVAIHAPFLRPGFSNQNVYIQACNGNLGTGAINNAYAIIELDSLLTVQSASRPYTSLGNNQYQVNLDTIYPGQCVNFSLACSLSVTAVLGQTLCMNARLLPLDSCALDAIPNPSPPSINLCNTPFDFSDLVIRPACNNDTISFVITNMGDGDMTCFSQVRLYIDGVLVLIDSVQLLSGASITFSYLGDGRTWRLEVDQHPLHYGNSQPSATIELCGNAANWTSNLVNILPQDDADPIIDIYCGLVTGSYDPNDKTGYPLGVGTQHDILPNQDLEYVINFQNTGTDTAFTVVIRDTLSTDFDIFTVRSGVSSADYSFRMYGPRVLEWTFSNIMLPDSNVNEAASHGFVTFKVKQVPDLPLGTVLENSASIYFDFNAPIFTNTSWHTINNNLSVITAVSTIATTQNSIKIYPNPTSGLLHIDQEKNQEITIAVFDNLGRLLLQQQTSDRISDLNINHLPTGIYLVSINNGRELVTQKIVKR